MERRNPDPNPNPLTRTLLVIAFLAVLSVAGAGREHLATLDAGISWVPSAGSCSGSGPLADVAANAAADSAPCASLASARDRGGDAIAGSALQERPMPSLAR